ADAARGALGGPAVRRVFVRLRDRLDPPAEPGPGHHRAQLRADAGLVPAGPGRWWRLGAPPWRAAGRSTAYRRACPGRHGRGRTAVAAGVRAIVRLDRG